MALPAFCRPCRWAAWSRRPTHRGVPITGCSLSGSPVPIALRWRCHAAGGIADLDLDAAPTGLSRLLPRRKAAQTAILFAFDLIEHDGENLRDCPFLSEARAGSPVARCQGQHPAERTHCRRWADCVRPCVPRLRARVSCRRRQYPFRWRTLHQIDVPYRHSHWSTGRDPDPRAEGRERRFEARFLDEQGILPSLVILNDYTSIGILYTGAAKNIWGAVNCLRHLRKFFAITAPLFRRL
jgi:hypothetical protein